MSDWRQGFHLSGANDVSAWSADGSRVLNLRVNQLPHNVAPTDSAIIGYIPFTTGAPCLSYVCLPERWLTFFPVTGFKGCCASSCLIRVSMDCVTPQFQRAITA